MGIRSAIVILLSFHQLRAGRAHVFAVMLKLHRNVIPTISSRLPNPVPFLDSQPTRFASVNTGINQGLRQTRRQTARQDDPKPPLSAVAAANRASAAIRKERKEMKKQRDEGRAAARASMRKSMHPIKIHYTSPASQFFRDERHVLALLKSSRRELYRLYISNAVDSEAKSRYARLGSPKGMQSFTLQETDLRDMERALFVRPASSIKFILECSPPPEALMQTLEAHGADKTSRRLRFSLPKRQNDGGIGTTTPHSIRLEDLAPGAERFPFLLWLHGVKNIGNIGAIFRSAAYFGVDAILLTEKETGSLNPGVLDASAGSSDAIPAFRVHDPVSFISRSQDRGWQFLAATARNPHSMHSKPSDKSPLQAKPTVVVLGDEHSGVGPHVLMAVDGIVTIPGQSAFARHIDLDSLNVSVAGAMIMERFLRSSAAESEEWKDLITWTKK